MATYGLPYTKAFLFVQEKRYCINPNEGFARQLMVSGKLIFMKWAEIITVLSALFNNLLHVINNWIFDLVLSCLEGNIKDYQKFCFELPEFTHNYFHRCQIPI